MFLSRTVNRSTDPSTHVQQRSVTWREVEDYTYQQQESDVTPHSSLMMGEVCETCILPDCYPQRPDCKLQATGYVSERGMFRTKPRKTA